MFFLLSVLTTSVWAAGLYLDKFSNREIVKVRALLAKLSPLILEREKRGDLAKLTFGELYASLSPEEHAFLEAFQGLNGKELGVKIPYRGFATGQEPLVTVKGQAVRVHAKEAPQALPVQFLPFDV